MTGATSCTGAMASERQGCVAGGVLHRQLPHAMLASRVRLRCRSMLSVVLAPDVDKVSAHICTVKRRVWPVTMRLKVGACSLEGSLCVIKCIIHTAVKLIVILSRRVRTVDTGERRLVLCDMSGSRIVYF